MSRALRILGQLLNLAQGPVESIPVLPEAMSGMEHCQSDRREDDHRALERQERGLVVCDRAAKSVFELDDSKDGSDEDAYSSKSKCCMQELIQRCLLSDFRKGEEWKVFGLPALKALNLKDDRSFSKVGFLFSLDN